MNLALWFFASVVWGIYFFFLVWPCRKDYGILCPEHLGWRVTTSLIHAIIWPLSLVQIVGWEYLNRRK